MAITITRHAQTDYSAKYLVNGDPTRPVGLTSEGRYACGALGRQIDKRHVRTWIVTRFGRTHETARLVAGNAVDLVTEHLLDELDYGWFDGGAFLAYGAWLDRHGGWRRPPGATESQREGLLRMLRGLRASLEHPGPQVVIAHGLLVSMIRWYADDGVAPMPLFFPEAPYAQPLELQDDDLDAMISDLTGLLHAERDAPDTPAVGKELKREEWLRIATVEPSVRTTPTLKDSHHA